MISRVTFIISWPNLDSTLFYKVSFWIEIKNEWRPLLTYTLTLRKLIPDRDTTRWGRLFSCSFSDNFIFARLKMTSESSSSILFSTWLKGMNLNTQKTLRREGTLWLIFAMVNQNGAYPELYPVQIFSRFSVLERFY